MTTVTVGPAETYKNIQAGINALSGAGPHLVKVKPGTYSLAAGASIVLNVPNTTLTVDGDGHTPVIIEGEYPPNYAFSSGTSSCIIPKGYKVEGNKPKAEYTSLLEVAADNCVVDGKYDNGTSVYGIIIRYSRGQLLSLTRVKNVTIKHVWMDFCFMGGVRVYGCEDTLIEDCALQRAGTNCLLSSQWQPVGAGPAGVPSGWMVVMSDGKIGRNNVARRCYTSLSGGEGFVSDKGTYGTVWDDCESTTHSHVQFYNGCARDSVYKNCVSWYDSACVGKFGNDSDTKPPQLMVFGDEGRKAEETIGCATHGRYGDSGLASRNPKVYNCLFVGGTNQFEMRGNNFWTEQIVNGKSKCPSYMKAFSDFYFGYNTCVSVDSKSLKAVEINQTADEVSPKVAHVFGGGIIENNIFAIRSGISGPADRLVKQQGNKNIQWRSNVWSHTPPSGASGPNDVVASNQAFSNNTYAIPSVNWVGHYNQMVIPIVRLDRSAFNLTSNSPAVSAAKGSGSIAGFIPPSVPTDAYGNTRTGQKDAGFHEYGGTQSAALEASYTESSTSIISGGAVQFTDTSTVVVSTITGRSWDFGDGSSPSTATNPSHVYIASGTYTVTLTVTATGGLSDSYSGTPINVAAAGGGDPEADFTQSATGGIVPLTVEFYNASTTVGDETVFDWDFGDGEHSSEASPIHIYNIPGSFIPSLNLIDGAVSSLKIGDTITVTEPTIGQLVGMEYVTLPTSAGDMTPIAFSELGDAPASAFIYAFSGATASDTGADNGQISIGYSDTEGNSYCTVLRDNTGKVTTQSASVNINEAVIAFLDDGSADVDGNVLPSCLVTLNGIDEDGALSLSVDDPPPAAYKGFIIAFGGSGMDAKILYNKMVGTLAAQWPLNVLGHYDLGFLVSNAGEIKDLSTETIEKHADMNVSAIAGGGDQVTSMWRSSSSKAAGTMQSWMSGIGTFIRNRRSGGGLGQAVIESFSEPSTPYFTIFNESIGVQYSPMFFTLPEGMAKTVGNILIDDDDKVISDGHFTDLIIFWGTGGVAPGTNYFNNTYASRFMFGAATSTKMAMVSLTSADATTPTVCKSWYDEGYIRLRDAGVGTAVAVGTIALDGNDVTFDFSSRGRDFLLDYIALGGGQSYLEPPSVDFYADHLAPLTGQQVVFVPSVTGNDYAITDLAWDFGDGSALKTGAVDENVAYIYTYPGSYTITLYAHTPGATFLKSKENYIVVTNRDGGSDGQWVQEWPEPHPDGVTNYSDNVIYDNPDDRARYGLFSQSLNLDSIFIDENPVKTSVSKPGKIRIYLEVATKDLILTSELYGTARIPLTWTLGAADPPELSPISNGDFDGSYTVSWSQIGDGTSHTYELQERHGSGAYAASYSGASLSKAVTGRTAGQWTYRVRGVSIANGDQTDWSNEESADVVSGGSGSQTRVAAGDAWEDAPAGTVDLTGNKLVLKGVNDVAAIRFTGFTLAHDTPITSAILSVYVIENTPTIISDNPNVSIDVEYVDATAALTTGNASLSTRTKTTHPVTWNASALGPGRRDIDITTPIQYLVNRDGWNGDITVIITALSGSRLRTWSYNSDYRPTLVLNY